MPLTGEEKLPRPPRRCHPQHFYVEYLPSLWRALADGLSWPSYSYELSFQIRGGENFVLRYGGGDFQGRAGNATDPLATMSCDRTSWELAVWDLFGRGIRRTNKRLPEVREEMRQAARGAPKLHPDRLRAMPGQIAIEFCDEAGDQGRYLLAIAGGDGPRARVEAGEGDLWALVECGGEFVKLLKSRAQLAGDISYLFKLARFFAGE